MDLQLREPLLDLAQDLGHRVVAGIHHPHPQARGRAGGTLGGQGRPLDLREDLAGFDQQGPPGRGELHVVGGAVQQQHAQFAFEALELLARGRLDDVLAGGRPAEVQLLGQGDEVAQLAKLHARHPRLQLHAEATAPSPTATASRQSCSWPVPPRRGGCCPPESVAVARRRPAGAGSPSGPRPACSTPCPSGRRRVRPDKIHADKGYDSQTNRAWLRRRGIRPRIARRGIESSSRLRRHRWRVERSLSWLSCWRRLQLRWDRDSGRWFAFVLLACAVVCFNRLQFEADRKRRAGCHGC
jgi:hypothetical protein